MKCIKGLEVQPLKSACGYYMGTLTEDGYPNCRITRRYADSLEQAYNLPYDRQTGCIENEFCNNGYGCFTEIESVNTYE